MVRTTYCCPSGAPTSALFTELPKTSLLLGTSVNKAASLPAGVPSRLGFQPQRNVGWLHSLPYHTYQVLAQGVQVCLVAQLGREGFQGLPGIVLPPVETPVYERLYVPPQRGKYRRYQKGGRHDREGGPLARKGAESVLQTHHPSYVGRCQENSERAVDEGPVDEYVYLVEAVPQDGEAHRDRYHRQAQECRSL